jgi:hypothetical protein
MKCVKYMGVKTSYKDLLQKLPEHAKTVWNIGMSYFIISLLKVRSVTKHLGA